MEAEQPAQAPALEDPVGFEALGDDLVLRACLRAPFVTHGSLHAVCHRFKSLLRSDDFRKLRLEFGLAEYGIVVAGGLVRGDPTPNLATAECWMLSSGRWRSIPPMSGLRMGACSVIIDNEMWVMGGLAADGQYQTYEELKTVEIYSPKTNSWRTSTPMRQGRSFAVAGVVRGRVVVAGGVSSYGDATLASAEAFTWTARQLEGTWIPLPDMPHETERATACVLNGQLHVIGGLGIEEKLQVLEMTEQDELSWSCKADLPEDHQRFDPATVVHNGKIWVMGGSNDEERPSSSSTYDAENEVWESALPLPSPCSQCCAATAEGGIFLFHTDEVFEKHGRRSPRWSVVHPGGAQGPNSRFAVCGSLLLG